MILVVLALGLQTCTTADAPSSHATAVDPSTHTISTSRRVERIGADHSSPSFSLTEASSLSLPFTDWAHGLSALAFDGSENQLIALSDKGMAQTLTMQFDATGTMVGVTHNASNVVTRDSGAIFRVMDVESAARQSNGRWLVGLERPNRLVEFPAGDLGAFSGQPQPWADPRGLRSQPINKGIESLTFLPDGRAILLGESAKSGAHPVWIGTQDSWLRLTYRTSPGFSPVEAALHPCGGVLVLERAANIFRGLTARLAYLSEAQIASAESGVEWEPLIIGPIEPSAGHGNFEGMAVRALSDAPCPAPIELFVVTDDNVKRWLPRILAHYRLAPTDNS